MTDRNGGSWVAWYARLALATAFFSAVADRVGLWGSKGTPGVAWGDFGHFLTYTAKLNPWLPGALLPSFGAAVTALEVVLGVMLIAGYRLRIAAAGSGVLLLGFALGMIVGDGPKAPLDASVFSASACAFLLMRLPVAARPTA